MAEKSSKTKESETLSLAELEKAVMALAKKGLTSEKIGLELKNKYKLDKKPKTKISSILRKNNLFEDPDIKNLTIKVEKLKKHLNKNKHDYKTKRSLLIQEAKLNKLKKYRKIK